jgi:hypothetical protein
VDEKNSRYSSPEGILFDKTMTKLFAYPGGRKEDIYTIPKSVTSIGQGAFYQCSRLTGITIPSGVTSIEFGAFGRCSGLTDIILPSSLSYIDRNAFIMCSNLREIIIPAGVPSIGEDTFYQCTNLTCISIPASVTSIERDAFYNCYNLKTIMLSNNSSLDRSVFPNGVEIVEVDDSYFFSDENDNNDFAQLWQGINKTVVLLTACILAVLAVGILIFVKKRKTQAQHKDTNAAP